MLILLSERFKGRLDKLAADPCFLNAVQNLARSHQAGYHIVSGPGGILQELIHHLSGDAQGIFKEIKKRHYEVGAVRNLVTHWIVVEPDADIEAQEKEVREQVSIHVPYTYFGDLGRAGRTRMIAEDRDDATIYKAATEGYVFSTPDVKRLRIELEIHGGGGQNTADALRSHARYGITLAITDSDRKWPGASHGGTSLELKRTKKELEHDHIIDLIVLPCHELENLLPGQLVIDSLAREDAKDFRERCLRANILGLLGASEPLYHLDLKNGLCLRDVVDAASRPPEHSFLENVFLNHRDRAPRPAEGWCKGDVACTERGACRCILFEGLGDTVVKHCAKRVTAGLTPQKSAEYFFAANLACTPIWNDLCREIFSWGCAYKRSRT